jgi:CheY-like chemotaxis protein
MSEKRTILVAEDSDPNRKIICQLLAKFDFTVIECKSGQEAWDNIEGCEKSNTKIDAIFSDIMMPQMGGLELLEKIRKENKLESVPFIFITALAEKEQILKAKELKAQGYILKPISAEKLLKKCKELFADHTFPMFPKSA